jgi:hypothetical protein
VELSRQHDSGETTVNAKQVTKVARQLQSALGENQITELGRSTGFTKRLREVTPYRLGVALLCGMGCREVETIADLRRTFQTVTGRRVEYKPFHNQLAKASFPDFMRGIFEGLLEGLALRTLAPVPGNVLRRFDDIVIHDGSSLGLHEGLRRTFPGRFSNSCPAAVELHATMSVLDGQPLRVIVAADSQAERQFLPAPEELRNRLLLADRGYMDVGFCAALADAGASFIIRFARSANPFVVGGTRDGRRFPTRFLGRQLKACGPHLNRRDADLDVEFRREGQTVRLRLVLAWNPKARHHVLLATNLPRPDFNSDSVRRLYRLRWQVELLFKEWKSYANLKTFCTRKAPIAEGLIWAALAACLLKRFLAHAAQVTHGAAEVSTRIAAMALSSHLPRLLDALLFGRPLRVPLESALGFLADACKRAHPCRERVTGRLAAGLRLTYLNAGLATCVAKD